MLLNLGRLELEADEVERALPILEEAAGLLAARCHARPKGWLVTSRSSSAR
jgi:hypothetical protein